MPDFIYHSIHTHLLYTSFSFVSSLYFAHSGFCIRTASGSFYDCFVYNRSLGEVTVDQAIGGARGVKCMLWETSLLDPEEGIRFRGYTIPELQQALPPASGVAGGEPGAEALLWLLLTGTVPTPAEAKAVTEELHSRAKLPAHVEPLLRSLPKDMHPMTKFSMGVLALQTTSKFADAYAAGMHKSKYFDPTYEDMMNLIANLPEIAAIIYQTSFKSGDSLPGYDSSLDYAANYCRLLGYTDPEFDELMRLYLVIHSDHEGGNASAHTTHLVGSALSDAYLSYASGLTALAGPLHGLANQEVLNWILNLQKSFKEQNKPVK